MVNMFWVNMVWVRLKVKFSSRDVLMFRVWLRVRDKFWVNVRAYTLPNPELNLTLTLD